MADRFPLVVNETSRKIEELISGDNIDLTGNGISVDGSTGISGQYLKSTNIGLTWDNPGDVYTTLAQTVSNKIFEGCTFNASLNSISQIPNASLDNSSITINNVAIPLGGTVVTPNDNDNTLYSLSVEDGDNADEAVVKLTGTDSTVDQIQFTAGTNVSISQAADVITIASSYVDTITTLQAATNGVATSGAITIAAGSFTTVTQDGSTITIIGQNDNTISRIRGLSGNSFMVGDVTLLAGASGNLSITQDDDTDNGGANQTITLDSVDTITSIKGGTDVGASFVSGQVALIGGTNVSIAQSSNDITISSTDTNTVTKLGSSATAPAAGDFKFAGSGATILTQTAEVDGDGVPTGVQIFTFDSSNDDTGATLGADNGLVLSNSNFGIKNASNFTTNTIQKWDDAAGQFTDSIASDDGETLTITGNLQVTGDTTTVNSSILRVADPIIELRTGSNLTAGNGGIQVNLETDSEGAVSTYVQLQYLATGNYWRTWDGATEGRLVTEDEVQTLTNKTLTSPVLTTPDLGAATATSINSVIITESASATLTIVTGKTLTINKDITFDHNDDANNKTINFGNGPGAGSDIRVAYTSDKLSAFASTTSQEFSAIISDASGSGALIFNQDPSILSSITTTSETFNLLNTNALTVYAFGAATSVNIGASSPAGYTAETESKTNINSSLVVDGNATFNTDGNDTFIVKGQAYFRNKDLVLYESVADTADITVGRGTGQIATNTVFGHAALGSGTVSGSQNTLFGYEVGAGIVSGAQNTAFGFQALKGLTSGDKNVVMGDGALTLHTNPIGTVAIGSSAGGSSTGGSNNVLIGFQAGNGCQGSGNVIIGPADTDPATDSVTLIPPSQAGNRQLVIGSGPVSWIVGDQNGDITIGRDLDVTRDLTVTGNLNVKGTQTTINTRSLDVDDHQIELGAVAAENFAGTVTDASDEITNVDSVEGLVVGMSVIGTGGVNPPGGTTITNINENDPNNSIVTLSNPLSVTGGGSLGNITFQADGPTDLSAEGGGIIVKGGVLGDKSILYDGTQTDKYWVLNQNVRIPTGKEFAIGNGLVLNSTTLGESVVNSSLTSVGSLTSLTVEGASNFKKRITEGTENNFTTSNSGDLDAGTGWTIDCSDHNTILYTTAATSFVKWNFENVSLSNGESYTLTLIIDANTAAEYKDDCVVDGSNIPNGVKWSGGSAPQVSSGIDILTFLFVKDAAGTVQVFGQGNTNFS